VCGRSHERGVRGNPALYPVLREEFDPHIERHPVDPKRPENRGRVRGALGEFVDLQACPMRCRTQALFFVRVELAYVRRRPAEEKLTTDAL
jgi:hypothetical protein